MVIINKFVFRLEEFYSTLLLVFCLIIQSVLPLNYVSPIIHFKAAEFISRLDSIFEVWQEIYLFLTRLGHIISLPTGE